MNLNFAENLKHLRKEKGVTQEKLSEVLGVSAQSVSRWELAICYPDIEMLPAIANYFGTTVDALLSNDTRSKEQDQEIFYQTVNTLSNETTERIDFVLEYCRKYPEDDKYAFNLVRAIQEYAVGDEKKTEKYMPLLMKYVPRLLETKFRNYTIQSMATLCNEKELDKWLSMTPYNSGFSRRYCLEARAGHRNDLEEEYVQRGLGMLESLAVQLDGRYPDRLGPQNKAEFQKKILRVIESLGDGEDIPDGWKCFYAYKQLVLAACLFGQGKEDEGWKHFDSAIEKCQYIHSLNDEWLDIGGALFSNIKVNKIWNYAMDENGKKRKLFAIVNYSFADMSLIHTLLTNPRWAWFDSVRQTPKYQAALQWVSEAEKKIRENA